MRGDGREVIPSFVCETVFAGFGAKHRYQSLFAREDSNEMMGSWSFGNTVMSELLFNM